MDSLDYTPDALCYAKECLHAPFISHSLANQSMTETSLLNELKAAKTKGELAKILNVKLVFLTNVLYRLGVDNQYSTFFIPKKGGGERIINTPSRKLKDLQKKIASVLTSCRQEIFSSNNIKNTLSHGFEKDRSIITNALKHRGKNTVLNLDLSNFFESINFGRIRGFFISNKDFNLHPDIATTIAHAACYKGLLPQGSPCSPIITNLICNILDIRLHQLAKKLGCTYSRYADDITFSTNKKVIPAELAVNDTDGVIIGHTLRKEIQRAGFNINDSKTRVSIKPSRHEVTGLTVNKFVNIDRRYSKKVRALAHSQYRTGTFIIKNDNGKEQTGTLQQLEGMFGFINQIDKFNNIENKKKKLKEKYVPLQKKLHEHRSGLSTRERAYSKFIYYKNFHGNEKVTLIFEGKTDRVYFKAALQALEDKYPTFLINNKKNKTKSPNFNIINPAFKERYFLDIEDGATSSTKFTKRYEGEFKSYYGTQAKNPVIMIMDNDTGPNELLNFLAQNCASSPNLVEDIRKNTFTHVMHNLYLVLTPLGLNGKATEMEDLFDSETLNKPIDGKRFSRAKKINLKEEFDKDDFSLKVVKAMAKEINFNGFLPIFNAINDVINHYQGVINPPSKG